MITLPAGSSQPVRWQQELADAVSDVGELARLLQLDVERLPDVCLDKHGFPLRVPRAFVRRMRKGDPDDPLLRQVLPALAEDADVEGFHEDPVGDLAMMLTPGLLQKYHGRALLIATGACAVHCRFCFRRHFPYADLQAGRVHWDAIIEQLRKDPSLVEVILSGGDPLSLSDSKLAELVTQIESVVQIQRLRIHTRQPIVLPARVDSALLKWIEATRLKTVIVLHCNHANEIDGEVASALAALSASGTVLLNQSVLLRGINDSVDALSNLSQRLFDVGVLPYYLHLLDPVRGAAHFDVAEDRAKRLLAGLQAHLPGYLVPRLVREGPGARSKHLLAP